MVVGNKGRSVQEFLFTPVAKGLLAVGLTPNSVTVLGTVLTAIAALTLIPLGYLTLGALVLGVLVLTDSIDGIMARVSNSQTPYGAFLDSSLDRLSDAAIFSAVGLWFLIKTEGWQQIAGVAASLACISLGAMVSYVRAKAEALQVSASMGLAERSDRIIIVLVATLLTGLGVPTQVYIAALIVLALLSGFTVIQRMSATRKGLSQVND